MRGNALSNASVVALVDACLAEGNNVHMIDLQQNLITLDGLEDTALMLMRGGHKLLNASLYKQGSVLLPILQLRCPHKLLLVDLRYNRLQHVRGGQGGESVKQRMKRVLLRVCRLLNTVGRGSEESLDTIDWNTRTTWMTDSEVTALIDANSQRKAEEDRRRAGQDTGFDTTYVAPPNRKTSDLDAKNVNVRPVLPPPPKRGSGGLPRIGTGEGGKSRRGSAIGGKREEEMKVQEEVMAPSAVIPVESVGAVESAEQVEGGVEAGDEYGEAWAEPETVAAE